MSNDDGLVGQVRIRKDVSSRDRDVRARIDETTPHRAHHRQDPGVSDVKPIAGQLNSGLSSGSRGRLRKEAVLLKGVLPALSGLGAGDTQMGTAASRTLIFRNGVPSKDA